jgi:hypothetical protein
MASTVRSCAPRIQFSAQGGPGEFSGEFSADGHSVRDSREFAVESNRSERFVRAQNVRAHFSLRYSLFLRNTRNVDNGLAGAVFHPGLASCSAAY